MLRFSELNLFKINSYNVEKANGWIYYPPILSPDEWESVFTELHENFPTTSARDSSRISIWMLSGRHIYTIRRQIHVKNVGSPFVVEPPGWLCNDDRTT